MVETTRPLMGQTEPQIFATPRQEDCAIPSLAEGGLITEGAVAHSNELLICKTMGVQVMT
jgi:hypothetical protein